MNAMLSPNENRHLGDLAGKVMMVAGLIGIAGLGVSFGIALFVEDQRPEFFRAYLTAFVFVVTLALGAMFFTCLHHLTRAGWSVTMRRLAEGISTNLIWLGVLFIPIVIGLFIDPTLYRWAHPETITDHNIQKLLEGKEVFLNTGFWLIRALFYFGIWSAITWFFYKNSVKQDGSGDPHLSSKMQGLAPPFMIIFALTLSLAGIDWVETLEFEWFSTMFGVYMFAGACCGGFAFLIITAYLLQRTDRITESVTIEHFQDMGKILFAFGIVFWAYIGFSQYMLIWYANIPEETTWFMARQLGDWKWWSLLLLFGHFVGPFVLLVSKHPKRARGIMALAAGWMLLMHYVDIYWLVMPRVLPAEIMAGLSTYADAEAAAVELGTGSLGLNLLHVSCLVGLMGLFVAGAAFRLRNVSLIPEQDPRLGESLAFENF